MELDFGNVRVPKTKESMSAIKTVAPKDTDKVQLPFTNSMDLDFGNVRVPKTKESGAASTSKPVVTPPKQTTTAPQTDVVAPVPVQETPIPVGPQSQTTEEFVATEYPEALTFEELHKKQSEREELDLENPRPVLVTGLSKDHTEYSKLLKEKVVGEFATLKSRVDERFDAEQKLAENRVFDFSKMQKTYAESGTLTARQQLEVEEALKKTQELEEDRNLTLEQSQINAEDAVTARYNYIASVLEADISDPANLARAQLTKGMLELDADLMTITTVLGGADWTPFVGTAIGILEIPKNIESARKDVAAGEYGSAAFTLGISTAELLAGIVGGKAIISQFRKAGESTDEVLDQITNAEVGKIEEKKAEVTKEYETTEAQTIAEETIAEWEYVNEVTVSSFDANGKLVIDYDKMRAAGVETAADIGELQDARARAALGNADDADLELMRQNNVRVGSDQDNFMGLTDDVDDIVSPLVKPEKFQAIVAIASDLKRKNPTAFPKDKPIIESLFDLTVGKDIAANQELADTLSKYGLSFDDYVLAIAGTGSEAGKILNRLSQIRRAGSLDELANAKNKALEMSQGKIKRTWRRLENIRRGGMVSMIKTAARNLQSAAIRAPMEAVENLIDTALKVGLDEGLGALGREINPFNKTGYYTGSFSHLKYMFKDPKRAELITDHLLNRPEFEKQNKMLLDNINEYQKATGRGEGGALDAILSKGEDVVELLNAPNRWQEHLIRRGMFMGELNRLVKREYRILDSKGKAKGIEELLREGKLPDLMANSSSVRPTGSPTFESLIEDSMRRALDVTYAKGPDIKAFRDTANFITRNGLTVVVEFPRFMFNSMELMGQYSAGAFNPALQRIFRMKKGKLDAKDRQNISRNITGLVGITAAYQYRASEYAPANYKQVNTGAIDAGTVMDVTPQFPLRQMLWIGEAIKRLDPNASVDLPVFGEVGTLKNIPQVQIATLGKTNELEGTFGDWFDAREFAETFAGTALRTGTGNVFIDEIAQSLGGAGDIETDQRAGEALGAVVGNYLATWGIPLRQAVELQRAAGLRTDGYVDTSERDIRLEGFWESAGSAIQKKFDMQQGLLGNRANLFNPSEEYNLPERENIAYGDVGGDGEPNKERVDPMGSLLLGFNRFTEESDEAQYLEDKGFPVWKLSSRNSEPDLRNEENRQIRQFIPTLVKTLEIQEELLIEQYKNKPDSYKKEYTVQQHVNATIREGIKTGIATIKSTVNEVDKQSNGMVSLSGVEKQVLANRVQGLGAKPTREDFEGGSKAYKEALKKYKSDKTAVSKEFIKTFAANQFKKIPSGIRKRAILQLEGMSDGKYGKFDKDNLQHVLAIKLIADTLKEQPTLFKGLMSKVEYAR